MKMEYDVMYISFLFDFNLKPGVILNAYIIYRTSSIYSFAALTDDITRLVYYDFIFCYYDSYYVLIFVINY